MKSRAVYVITKSWFVGDLNYFLVSYFLLNCGFTSYVIILIFQRHFYNYLGLFRVGISQLLLKNCVLSSNVLEYYHIFFYRFCTCTSYLIPNACTCTSYLIPNALPFILSIKGNTSSFVRDFRQLYVITNV